MKVYHIKSIVVYFFSLLLFVPSPTLAQTAKVMAKIPPNWMMVSQIQTLPSSGLSE